MELSYAGIPWIESDSQHRFLFKIDNLQINSDIPEAQIDFISNNAQ